MKKRIAMFTAVAMTAVCGFAEPTVTDVVAKQRYPWDGLVDITCKVSGIEGVASELGFAVTAVMLDSGGTNKVSHLWVVCNGTNSTDYVASTNGEYRLVWNARSDMGRVNHSNMILRVTLVKVRSKVQLWEGGPYWATTNIGADEPEEYGYYFWWGDTVGYKREDDAWVASDGLSSNFQFYDDPISQQTLNKSIDTLVSEGWVVSKDGTCVLAPEHDAAQVQWGGGWRMPTEQELSGLNSNCDWTWTTQNGVNGYEVRGKGDYVAACIFLPCAGLGNGTSLSGSGSGGSYWSSDQFSGSPNSDSFYAGALYFGLDFGSSSHYTCGTGRYYGVTIRPVQGFIETPVAMVGQAVGRAGDSAPFQLNMVTTSSLPTDEPTVTVKQRFPWNGLVDIICKVSGIEGTASGLGFALEAVMPDSGITNKVSHFWVVRNGTDSTDHAVHTNGDYRIIWDAQADVGQVNYSNMVLRVTIAKFHDKVQLWEGGPYWATTNIGADEPEEYGYYFWWGDTVGYKRENDAWVATDGSSSNFQFYDDPISQQTYNKSIATLQSEGWITADNVLAPEHDAAQVQWGGGWRMPTKQELSRLNSKCDWAWTTLNGINGYEVRGRGDYASNSIFLPCAGHGNGTSLFSSASYGTYWSSVLNSDNRNRYSWGLYTGSGSNIMRSDSRSLGYSVRPVQGFTETSTALFGRTGDSAPFPLNTLPSPVVDSLSIPWNAAWVGGDPGATVVIADNGNEVKRTSGAGEFVFSGDVGRHDLTYTTCIDGVAHEEVYAATVYVQWKYEVVNGGAVVTDKAKIANAATIPSEIDGYPVTGISNLRVDGNGDNGLSTVTFRANGSGRLSFRWKASSEYDLETGAIYDYGYLTVDGVVQGTLDESTGTLGGYAIGGVTDWVNVVFDVPEGGEHTFAWTYKKDAYQEAGLPIEDCIWLDRVVWGHPVSVTFDIGDGAGAVPAPIKDEVGMVVALPLADGFALAKHAFAGWSDGAETYAAGADYTVPATNVTLTAQWDAKTLACPTISSAQVANGGTVDDVSSVTLTLSAEAGATIHYTLDGSAPTAESTVCTGQLVLTGLAVTVKAISVRDDYFDSEVAEFSFTRLPNTLAECLGLGGVPNVSVTTGGDSPAWHRVVGAETHDGVACLRSGAITHSQTNWVEMTVTGPGTLTFWWKASSEKTVRGQIRDGATFFVDGTQVGDMIGGTDLGWAQVSYEVGETGPHTFRWAYSKSEADTANVGEDCAWLDDVTWTPDPIPEIGGNADVAEALAGSADGRLGKRIKTAAEYNAYRGWVDANGLDHGAVKSSKRAWFSYALDATNLIECAFQNGDVAIVSLETPSKGAFTFEVDIRDILIGASATAENLATVFEVQGAYSLSADSFSSANVDATLGVSTNGSLLVSVTPKAVCAAFFVRVRLHADDDGWTVVARDMVQLWKDGPYWASTNIGAEKPEDYGYYFWWGDTVGYKRENDTWVATDGSSSNFAFESENTPTYGKDTSTLQSEGWITVDNVLAPDHDAAQVQRGGGWRMPTEQELIDLNNNCDWTWTTKNGVYGYEVCGRGDYASSSIFLPCAGFGYRTSLENPGSDSSYWSSVPFPYSGNYGSWSLIFDSSEHVSDYGNRDFGRSIRPVQGFTK